MMKKIFKSKITMVILSCLLLVGVFAGVYTLANDNSVEISDVNIAHDGTVKVAYYLNVKGLDEENETLKVNFWGIKPEADDNGVYLNPEIEEDDFEYTDNGLVLIKSKGFAPAEMTQVVYAQAVIIDKTSGETVAHSKLVRYSVFEHICWLNHNSDNAKDKAMYNALESYITYAQKYLNIQAYDSPESLYYIQVNNGYIKPMDGTDNKYTSGVYTKDTTITVVADDPESFGMWYNEIEGNYLTAQHQMKSEYTIGLGKDFIYTAVPKSQITAEGGVVIPVVRVLTANKQIVSPTFVPYTDVCSESAAVAGYCAISAEASKAEGENTVYFSHWEKNGEVVSRALTYVFDATDGRAAADQTYTAVYTATANSQNMNCQTGAYEVTDKVKDSWNPETGVLDSSARPATSDPTKDQTPEYGGKSVSYTAPALKGTEAVAEKMIFSFDMCIDPRNILDDGDALSENNSRLDYFINYRSAVHNQLSVGVKSSDTNQINQGIAFFSIDASVDTTNQTCNYYTFRPRGSSDGDSALGTFQNYEPARLYYGKTYNIQVEVVTEKNGNSTDLDLVNLYVDGNYVGTSYIGGDGNSTGITPTGTLYLQFASLKRTRSIFTIKNIKVTEIYSAQ